MNPTSKMKVAAFASILAGGVAIGAVGAMATGVSSIIGAAAASATPSPGATKPAPNASPGTFHSNEDPAHEGAETPAQEAAENNGTFRPHGGPGGGRSNEDAAHEATESPDREAAEDAAAKAAQSSSNSSGTPAQ